MSRLIRINLPLTDLTHSRGFYETVGATPSPAFGGATAACMVSSKTQMGTSGK